MKLTFQGKELAHVLKHAIRVVPTKGDRPALKHVLIKAQSEKNRVDILTSNEELSLQIALIDTTIDSPVTIYESGSCLVPAREFYDIVKIAKDTVSLEMDKDPYSVKVQLGKAKYTLKGLEPTLFRPYENERGETTTVVLQAMALHEILQRTIYACEKKSDARPVLKGALFELKEQSFRMMGTDGHRLSLASIQGIEVEGESRSLPLPYSSLEKLQALLPANDDDEAVTLQIGDASLVATWAEQGIRIAMRGLNEAYPNVEHIIPKSQKYTFKFVTQELLDACERVDVLCDSEQSHRAVFKFNANELVLQGETTQFGSALARIEVKESNANEEITAYFNLSYWIQALKSLEASEYITVNLNTPNDPATITPESGQALALMAPLFSMKSTSKQAPTDNQTQKTA